MSLATQTYEITRANLVRYAEASGDQNPIHQDEAVATSVGLPGVIAHGMYTMALAARRVAEWFPGAEVVSFGTKVTQPVVVPADGSVEIEVAGEVKGTDDGLTTVVLDGHLCRAEGARHAQGRRPCPELLAEHTTLRLGGPVDRFVAAARSEAELVEAVSAADAAIKRCLVLGGGSNLVVADDGFRGTVVEIATTGVTADVEGDDPTCGGAMVTVAAGESWDAFVGHGGPAAGGSASRPSPGIPGLVGATPIQNVGAYGQDVSQTIASVRVWDRKFQRRTARSPTPTVGSDTVTSRFKADPGRHVVLEVTYQLRQGDLGTAVEYAELARGLGIEVGQRAPAAQVRDAVLVLRRGKGMVLDAADHDTWSAGSFFTNPVVAAEAGARRSPGLAAADGGVKTSAAWLIEHAGFAKGYGNDRVALSTKHTLALTNRGSGTTDDLLRLAREIRDGVPGGVRHPPGQRAGAGRLLALRW